MERFFALVFDCWPVKVCISILATSVTFLIGEVSAPLAALAVLVIIDTLTRWMAIGKAVLDEAGITASVWYGIYRAIHQRRINSRMMRAKFQSKVLGYVLLLIGFNLLSKVLPASFFGADLTRAPGVFISSWLAFVELQSVIENLIDMGLDALKPLLFWCEDKQRLLSGIKEKQR